MEIDKFFYLDSNNNLFNDLQVFCKHYNFHFQSVKSVIKNKSDEETKKYLDKKIKKLFDAKKEEHFSYTDPDGNVFESIKEVCEYYGFNYGSVRSMKRKKPDLSYEDYFDNRILNKDSKLYNRRCKEPDLNKENIFYKDIYKKCFDQDSLLELYRSKIPDYNLEKLNSDYLEAMSYNDFLVQYVNSCNSCNSENSNEHNKLKK